MGEAVLQDGTNLTPGGTAVSPRWPSGAQTVRVNWSMKLRAKTLAEEAGDAPGSSQAGYVSTVIEQRHAAWIGALEYLIEQGWNKREIREVLEALPQPSAFSRRPTWEVNETLGWRGPDRVSETVARAVLVLARERAAGNAELARRL